MSWMARYQVTLREETGIKTLKVGYTKAFGYYIEVTKTHLAKVPGYFERKQTTVSGERFTCPELRNKEHEVLTASLKAEGKAEEILKKIQNQIVEKASTLKKIIFHFSWCDAAAGIVSSCRKLSRFGPWIFPVLKTGDFHFIIKEARHPVMEKLFQGAFVANSLELGTDKKLLLLTGPNMAGKSTIMRQTGLCLILAQCGLPVPCQQMELAPSSGFFSRMGASDKILEGESTFMVEMKETALILREADKNSFVLIDEIGRGTSTEDGLAIAQAVFGHLHDDMGCVGIFATHYHELSELVPRMSLAQNGSMAIVESESTGDLTFLRSLKLEPAESSYGIYVAKSAGLPRSVLTEAQKFFVQALEAKAQFKGQSASKQLDFFAVTPLVQKVPTEEVLVQTNVQAKAAGSELLDELGKIALNDLSPRQAWLLLETLQEKYASLEGSAEL